MTEGAEFVKLFDPLLKEAFFYNCRTGDRLTAEDLAYEEAEAIALETYVFGLLLCLLSLIFFFLFRFLNFLKKFFFFCC